MSLSKRRRKDFCPQQMPWAIRCVATLFLATLMVSHVLADGASDHGRHSKKQAVVESHAIPHGPLPRRHHTHASTMTEAKDGTLLAAWFGGTKENNPDVDIWLSHKPAGKTWSEPVMIDDGSRAVGGKQVEFACWNPVLFTDPKSGTVYLWYKITGNGKEPGYKNWWGAVRTSRDNGRTWSPRVWLPKVDRQQEANNVFRPYDYRLKHGIS